MEAIVLQEYNTGWIKKFRDEKKMLLNLLGPGVIAIHHVGSTAVPGLLAKPIIDIAIEAVEYPPSVKTIEKLGSMGYQDRGESGVQGRTWFTKGSPREFHLHYCPVGSGIIKKQVKFRDSLMNNESLRRKYEKIKQAHAAGKDIDDPAYAGAKTRLIMESTGEENMIHFKSIPIFKIDDLKKAKEFYTEFLGFTLDWEHRFGPDEPVYLQVSNKGMELHLTENKRFSAGTIIFIESLGLEAFHSILSQKSGDYPVPEIIKTPWHTKQLELEDPFGNVLRFNETHPSHE